MRKRFRFASLLGVALLLIMLLNACGGTSGRSLEGYDYRGIGIGDSKEAVTQAMGEPISADNNEEDDRFSSISYADAEFILKSDKVIAVTINKSFTLPNGVAVDDPLSSAAEAFGADKLLQEPGNPLTLYALMENNYIIALSFMAQDEALYQDSSIDSIMIADAQAVFEIGDRDFAAFKQSLVPVLLQDRSETNSDANASGTAAYSQDFYGTWTPVGDDAGGSVYIELDEWDRGVLEFNNEGESVSYMIHASSRTDQETVVEYDDEETGETHEVSMFILNGQLHLSVDTGFSGIYEKAGDADGSDSSSASGSTSSDETSAAAAGIDINTLSGQWYPDGGISNLTPYALEFSITQKNGGMITYISLRDMGMEYETFEIEGFEDHSVDLYFDFDKIKVTFIDELHMVVEEYGNTSKFVKVHDPDKGGVEPKGYSFGDLTGKWSDSYDPSQTLTFKFDNAYDGTLTYTKDGKAVERNVNVSKHFGNEKSFFYSEQDKIKTIDVNFLSADVIEVTENGETLQYSKINN